MYSCLYTAHQRNRAILLRVVKEERPMHQPADKVIAPVPDLLDNPVLSHTVIIPKTLLVYRFYCINKRLTLHSPTPRMSTASGHPSGPVTTFSISCIP